MPSPFQIAVTPDYEGLVQCITRSAVPARVHVIELFLDPEIQDAICGRFSVAGDLDASDLHYSQKRLISIQRFLGYDYVRCGLDNLIFPLNHAAVEDTAGYRRSAGRSYVNEHTGPITSFEDFENYPWPDPLSASSCALEWYEDNLPDDMCVIAGSGFAHFAEYLSWLMGYESLCYALYDNRELVAAISQRLMAIYRDVLERFIQFKRVKLVWGSDDMGFRTGTLIGPEDLREFVLPGHKLMAEIAHAAGRPYLLHSCGNLYTIMNDLIDDVQIDARHSFEDTIQPVTNAKVAYGGRIALLGGIDMDFLCRASEEQVRQRVRQTLDICMAGSGYCLGTGNSVANYLPLNNFLAMLDEGRKYSVDAGSSQYLRR